MSKEIPAFTLHGMLPEMRRSAFVIMMFADVLSTSNRRTDFTVTTVWHALFCATYLPVGQLLLKQPTQKQKGR